MGRTILAKASTKAKPVLVFALPAMLSACSLTGNPSLERYGPGLDSSASISLHSLGQSSFHTAYKEALERSFHSKGFSLTRDSKYIADFAISARASDSAIAVVKDTSQEIDYVSSSRERKFLQECDGKRLRATLIVFDRSDGSVAFRGIRESDVCEVTENAVSLMADELVTGAVSR